MSFFDNVTLPTKKTPTVSASDRTGFFSGVSYMTPEEQAQQDRTDQLRSEQQIAAANAEYANSFRGIASTFFQPVVDYAKSGFEQAKSVASQLVTDPYATINKGISSLVTNVGEAAKSGFQQGKTAVDTMIEGAKTGQGNTATDIASLANLASGVANILLSPITGGFKTAEEIPIVRQAADAFNLPLQAVSTGAVFATGEIFDHLVKFGTISQETADILKEPISNLSSLAAQIALGDKIYSKVAEVAGIKKVVSKLDAKKIIDETPDEIVLPTRERIRVKGGDKGTEVPISTPPETNIPTIQYPSSPKVKSELPTLQYGVKERPINGYTYVPVRELFPDSQMANEGFFSGVQVQSNPVAVAERAKPTLEVGTGKEVVNTRAEKLLQAAVEKKLIERYADAPTHNKINIPDQAARAVDFIERNPEEAAKIIEGESLPPPDILATSIYTAMEIKAMQTGDAALIDALSRSPIPTFAGQSLKMLDSSDPLSPVKIIRDLRESLIGKIDVKAKQRERTSFKSGIKKEISGRPTWEQFINDISCNS